MMGTRCAADLTRSILVPFGPTRPQQMLPFAALAQWSDATGLWQGQAGGSDPFQNFTYAATQGFPTPIGTAVNLMPFAHPYDAAMRATTLANATGQPSTIGYGPGATSLQRGLLGSPYRKQLGAARDYLTIVRSLLETGQVAYEGEFYSCSMQMPHLPRPTIELGLGVLRPRMALLAGEIADAAITWLTPASYLRDVIRPALVEGAAKVGRPVPRIIVLVPVAITKPSRDLLDCVLASSRGHMALPHYTNMLEKAGIHVDIEADERASAEALVAGGAFLAGSRGEIEEALAEYAEAAADEVVFNLTGVSTIEGHRAALADLESLVTAL
ncbi:LLM class flavin-dependent oxidoreductase [Rathayibacter tritici]|uniref:LLM class flavin-dependent oxidoreductase n=2 Tax=Rathayibacter tritici TaxID=33888 RepID=UPI0015E1E454|nr:LLM class flavin-dependent oxidoreductase [Rathayibacter tritici]